MKPLNTNIMFHAPDGKIAGHAVVRLIPRQNPPTRFETVVVILAEQKAGTEDSP
jgi:hypothetical protein